MLSAGTVLDKETVLPLSEESKVTAADRIPGTGSQSAVGDPENFDSACPTGMYSKL